MAKKTKKSAEKIAEYLLNQLNMKQKIEALSASALCPGKETAAPAVETTPATTPTAQQPRPKRANLIVAIWYVYFFLRFATKATKGR